ncbi:MAG: hypothetical protein Q8R32_03890 [bacterium]|nr:hypothetical protein [bacterium]
MSRTVSPGLVDASSWIGVAATMAEYLSKWLTLRPDETLRPPTAAFADIDSFFRCVLKGIALERKEAGDVSIPPMAGISNLHIAMDTLATLNGDHPYSLEAIEQWAKTSQNCLASILKGDPREDISQEKVKALSNFFTELDRRGHSKRYEEFSRSSLTLG